MVIQCTILIVITNQVLYPGLCLMAAKQTENSFAISFKCKEAQLHFGVTNFGFCLEALKPPGPICVFPLCRGPFRLITCGCANL